MTVQSNKNCIGRYAKLGLNAVKRYLNNHPGRGDASILHLGEDSDNKIEGMTCFAATTYDGRYLSVVIDPEKNTVQVTDLNTGVVDSYSFLDLIWLILL